MNEDAYRAAEGRYWQYVGLEPTERRLHLKHSDVDVRVQEVGSGDAVLFVHGASNSGVSWANLVVHLNGYRCLLLDRPGAGLSEAVTEPFADVAALARFSDELVCDVLDALELPTAHVVATSYGGYAALRGAAAHPDRTERIVILGWMMGAANPNMPFFMRMAGIPYLARLMTKMPVNESVVRSMFKRIGLRRALEDGRISDELISCYTSLLKHTHTLRNEVEIGRWLIGWRGLNPEIVLPTEVLSKLRAPIHFLWGEDDPFGGPEVARAFAEQVPNAQLELMPGAGHAVWLDDSHHVAKVIDAHLTTASPPR